MFSPIAQETQNHFTKIYLLLTRLSGKKPGFNYKLFSRPSPNFRVLYTYILLDYFFKIELLPYYRHETVFLLVEVSKDEILYYVYFSLVNSSGHSFNGKYSL